MSRQLYRASRYGKNPNFDKLVRHAKCAENHKLFAADLKLAANVCVCSASAGQPSTGRLRPYRSRARARALVECKCFRRVSDLVRLSLLFHNLCAARPEKAQVVHGTSAKAARARACLQCRVTSLKSRTLARPTLAVFRPALNKTDRG